MKIPPLIIGVSAILWGMESGRLILGIILALLLEGNHLLRMRYALDEDDFIKISDLTSLVFLASVALVLLNYEARFFLRITTGWLPVVLAPLMLAQLYSTGNSVVVGTRLGGKRKRHIHKPFDLRVYYVVLCIFAAACANSGSSSFLPLSGIILFSLFFANRGRTFARPFSIVVFLAIVVAAFLLSSGMGKVHRYASYTAMRLMRDYYRQRYADPYYSTINFGDTGRLKNSGEIVLRVETEAASLPLLKIADYSNYSAGKWFGNYKGYDYLLPVDGENWELATETGQTGERLQIEYDLPKEKGVVPIPGNSYRLWSKTIYELEQNRSGNLRVKEGAPVITYAVDYLLAGRMSADVARGRYLSVPEEERYIFAGLKERLRGGDAEESIENIKAYFQDGFSYSLTLLGKGDYATPLGNFLLQKKRGFCEYYAAATTLLLRSCGIPSRYAVGFAIVEKSPLEGKYVVRKRHAHAWSEALVNGRWVEVDTTPSQWAYLEEEQASFYEPLLDFFRYLRHKYRLFRIGTGADYRLYLSFFVVGLTLFLILRIYRRMRLERDAGKEKERNYMIFPRIVTPFTPVLDFLEARKAFGLKQESAVDWAAGAYEWTDFNRDEFCFLYRLHMKKRFDPEGLEVQDLRKLKEGSRKYLDDIRSKRNLR